MIWTLILGALLLLIGGALLFRRARLLQHKTGLPDGEIVYDDTGVREELEKPLVSRRHGLVGRPDYLVRRADRSVIPVEVKSAPAPPVPYESHVLQLGAYCLLVEDRYRQRPSHGLLRYADATFRIPFTDELRYQVLDAAGAIRQARTAGDVARSHDEPRRCATCGYRNGCTESLA